MSHPVQAHVGPNLILDSRLALFHERESWLAAADLHFGYEISQRAAGRLLPFWGMHPIQSRLFALLNDYRPGRLVIIGDLVHDRAEAAELKQLLARIRERCELITIAGNHDRERLTYDFLDLVDSWEPGTFQFHHGHCAREGKASPQIIGHHHPAAALSDGAGLRLKFPPFVQQTNCWIMPAFSPWASGTTWKVDADSRVWLCTPAVF